MVTSLAAFLGSLKSGSAFLENQTYILVLTALEIPINSNSSARVFNHMLRSYIGKHCLSFSTWDNANSTNRDESLMTSFNNEPILMTAGLLFCVKLQLIHKVLRHVGMLTRPKPNHLDVKVVQKFSVQRPLLITYLQFTNNTVITL